MDRKIEAVNLFNKGFNCCQAVLSAFCEEIELDKELLLKLGTGFGGGMRKGEVCGAVSGAIMVLGLKVGHYIEGDTHTKEKSYQLSKEFIKKFEERNSSIICKKLLGYDLSQEEEYTILKEKGLFNTLCPEFIKDAIDLLEEMI